MNLAINWAFCLLMHSQSFACDETGISIPMGKTENMVLSSAIRCDRIGRYGTFGIPAEAVKNIWEFFYEYVYRI